MPGELNNIKSDIVTEKETIFNSKDLKEKLIAGTKKTDTTISVDQKTTLPINVSKNGTVGTKQSKIATSTILHPTEGNNSQFLKS